MDKQNSCLGIDIGGTFIKFLVLQDNTILYKSRKRTGKTCEAIIEDIVAEYRYLKECYSIESVGIGTPGGIKNGFVTAGNLPFNQFPLKDLLQDYMNCPVAVENDANCAALAEVYFGSAKDCQSMVLITLGTGIGGGIVLNKQIFRGTAWAGEIGHMVIQANQGRKCPCGLSGCYEQYASATALIRQAEEVAVVQRHSNLYSMYVENGNKLDGEIFFEAVKSGCPTAKEVLNQYLYYLAVGIENIAYILAPEVVVLAGGIMEEDEWILSGLKAILHRDISVRASILKNDAGSLGAAILNMVD